MSATNRAPVSSTPSVVPSGKRRSPPIPLRSSISFPQHDRWPTPSTEVRMALPSRPRVRFGSGDVYQLRIELDGIVPMIWRRIMVSGRASLHELHGVIQGAMRCDESTPYHFEVDGVRYL